MDTFESIYILSVVGTAESAGLYLIPAVMGLISLILLFGASRALWRKRLIENVPTSKVKGITIGLNELKGEAVSRVPMRSYLTGKDAVYYCYTIEEEYEKRERYRDKDGNWKTRIKRVWKTIQRDEKRPRFTLRDQTGAVRVVPEKAEIHAKQVLSRVCRRNDPLYGKGPLRSVASSTGRRRFREEVIESGDQLYLIGSARLREDIVAPEIAYEKTGEIFLISTRGEEKIISGYAWKARFAFFFSLLLGVGTPYVVFLVEGLDGTEALVKGMAWMILAGVLVMLGSSVLYMKAIYNGLVDVRNRSRRAWSMLEVELKRRHDLIPNLVNLVRATAEHELETLAAVTKARTAANVPSEPGAGAVKKVDQLVQEQTEIYTEVFAVVEKYPTIKANRGFEKLMEELTRCEDKIALARKFYNDSVERLNSRVESFPDLLFAPVARTTPRLFLGAEEFEKKPVQVELVEEVEPDPDEVGPELDV